MTWVHVAFLSFQPPVCEPMKLRVAAKSDPGRLGEHNEDFCLARKELGLYLVADGVGGHQAGEVASKAGCQLIDQVVRQSVGPSVDPSEHDRVLAEAIDEANAGVFRTGQLDAKKRGLGSTLAALWFHGDRVLFACVGDSRIYLFRDGALRQLSYDEKAGRYRLAASLGHEPTVEPQIGMVRLQAGDRFLLCTDGLHGPVPHDELVGLLGAEPDPARCCARLVAAANDHGGPDNITALVADVVEPDRPQRWHFSRTRVDATSRRARVAGTRKWLWAVVAVLAAALVLAGAVSLRPARRTGAGDDEIAGRIAVLIREANAKAALGDTAGTQRALEALVHQAVKERRRLERAGLGLHQDALRLYERAADAVWEQLYNRSHEKLTRLKGTPVEPYIQAHLRSRREQADRIREQFVRGDYRLVAETFDRLDQQADTIIHTARQDLEREKNRLENSLAVLRARAREFQPGNPTRQAMEPHIAAARAALDREDLTTARRAVDAARAALDEGN